MDLRLATLKAVSVYLLHNVSTLNQFRKLSCGTVVCKHFASYQDYPKYRWDLIRHLTLSMLMSYIYGAPCKARNFNVVYIWTYVWQRLKPSLSICCKKFQHWINSESYPVAQLCVNTLPASQGYPNYKWVQFGTLRVNTVQGILIITLVEVCLWRHPTHWPVEPWNSVRNCGNAETAHTPLTLN
jgi:hypothetical protein